MRTTSLVPVLAALISIASTFPLGYSAHQGRVAARDTVRVRSPATPPNFVARAKPSPERRNHAARQAPSPKHGDHIPRAAPSARARQDRRSYVPRAQPSARHARAEPSGVHHRRDEHVLRHESDHHIKRSPQGQNVFGNLNKLQDGLGWDEDQCPAPLSACPVRGASDVDAIECVDLYSDLYSCGGCAEDDIACVFLYKTPILFQLFFSYILLPAMIATQFPMYAALSVSLAPAEYTRALMDTQLRHRVTYVYLLGHRKNLFWCHCLA